MLTFRGFALIALMVLLRHFATPESDPDATRLPNAMILGTVAFAVVVKGCAVIAACRLSELGFVATMKSFGHQRTVLEWAWIVSLPILCVASGWSARLALLELQGWPVSLIFGLWFAPSLLLFFAFELSTSQLEQDCLMSLQGRVERSLLTRWWSRVRLGGTGSLIISIMPAIIILALRDLSHRWLPDIGHGLYAVVAMGLIMVTGLLSASCFLGLWVGARRVADGPYKSRVDELCQALHMARVPLCIVPNQPAWFGAAVVGWTGWDRRLWVSESLLKSLNPQQLDMVLLHELGHVKRGHCWWRSVPVILGASAIVAITFLFFQTTQLESIAGWMRWISLGAVGAALAIAISRLSIHCEIDADRWACEQAARLCEWANHQPGRAAVTLVAALESLHGPAHHASARSWLHPSLETRSHRLLSSFPQVST